MEHAIQCNHCGLLQRREDKVTVYMGVPTMYSYLLSHYDQAVEAEQQKARQVHCCIPCS